MKRFKKVYIEITNVCNLRCSFCPETKRSPEFMTFETFQRILEQIKPYTDYVYFHVKGEPLLHPRLAEFLDLCETYGLKANITTNGTLIQEAADKLLMKPALRQINFSLHCSDVSDSACGRNDYLSRIFSFIHRSVKTSPTIISLRLWNLRQPGAETGQARQNPEILSQIEAAFGLERAIDAHIDSARGIKLADKVFLSQDAEFEWPSLEKKHREEYIEALFSQCFCYGMKSQIAVLVDGTVVPCCLDGEGVIDLGNINATPFSEIIISDRAKNIHEGFSKKEAFEPLCRTCTYRHRFS